MRRNLTFTGDDVIRTLGNDAINELLLHVLTGGNIRSSTEILTRHRLSKITGSVLVLLMNIYSRDRGLFDRIIDQAVSELSTTKARESWILQWILGLTSKSVQNVLRDDEAELRRYAEQYAGALESSAADLGDTYGSLVGGIRLGGGKSPLDVEVAWDFMVYLMSIIGCATLTIRGSNKSAFGKLFERLVLGTVFTILGYEYTGSLERHQGSNFFLLSSTRGKREADATVVGDMGKVLFVDIGFIGRGNPEIVLDKVTRFESHLRINERDYDAATIILVDRVGENSKIREMARGVNAVVIQMSASHWPKLLSKAMAERGFRTRIDPDMDDAEFGAVLRREMEDIDFKRFLPSR